MKDYRNLACDGKDEKRGTFKREEELEEEEQGTLGHNVCRELHTGW